MINRVTLPKMSDEKLLAEITRCEEILEQNRQMIEKFGPDVLFFKEDSLKREYEMGLAELDRRTA